jgi:hypothetical protein
MNIGAKNKTSILLGAIVVAAGTFLQVFAYTGGEIRLGDYVHLYL